MRISAYFPTSSLSGVLNARSHSLCLVRAYLLHGMLNSRLVGGPSQLMHSAHNNQFLRPCCKPHFLLFNLSASRCAQRDSDWWSASTMLYHIVNCFVSVVDVDYEFLMPLLENFTIPFSSVSFFDPTHFPSGYCADGGIIYRWFNFQEVVLHWRLTEQTE